MNKKSKHIETDVKFPANIGSSILAGLAVGLAVSLVLGLKVAKINPSITRISEVWMLSTHFMLLYGMAGVVIGAGLGLIFYPFLHRKESIKLRSLFNLYLPTVLIIALFHYVRTYMLTHFIANPLMPLKGSLWINIAFSIILVALTVLLIKIAVKIFASWRLTRVAGSAAVFFIIGWAALGIISPGSKGSLPSTPAFQEYELKPSDAKVALIAIDGAWWEIIDALMAEDKLPNFKKLVDNGVRAELKTLYPTFSAMIWTSVITGKLPQKHGINSFLVWSFPLTGAKIPIFRLPYLAPELLWIQDNIATVSPIPSNYRTAEALWSIFSYMNKSVGVMSWWASWPAEQVNGYIFTDHALFNKMDVITNYKERGGASIHDIYPPELIPELQPFRNTPSDITRDELSRFVNIEREDFWREFQELNTYDYLDIAYEASMFKFTYPADKTAIEAAKYLLDKKGQPDFWAIYLQGIDSMSHQYLKYYFALEHSDKLIPVNLTRYRNLIENYYIYMDETLGEFLGRLDPATNVFVVSDHGFDKEMLPTGHYHHIKPGPDDLSEEFHITDSHPGIFIASGTAVKQGYKAEEVTVLDIAPTILNLMGFPFAQDFDGKVLDEIIENPTTPDTIPTYDQGRVFDPSIIKSAVDKEVTEKLKALGYVK